MLNIYHPRCLILPLLCNIFFLYQNDFLPICCHKVTGHGLPCFDSRGPTEENEKVFELPNDCKTSGIFIFEFREKNEKFHGHEARYGCKE